MVDLEIIETSEVRALRLNVADDVVQGNANLTPVYAYIGGIFYFPAPGVTADEFANHLSPLIFGR